MLTPNSLGPIDSTQFGDLFSQLLLIRSIPVLVALLVRI